MKKKDQDLRADVKPREQQLTSSAPWIALRHSLPAEGIIVDTKIDDENGSRNEQRLYRVGRLWFTEGGKMYVYYEPTHWRDTGAGK